MTTGPDIALTHTWLGNTGRYVCDRCDQWIEMERWADSRIVEKTQLDDGRTMMVEKHGGDLDPPARPTYYVCPTCKHAHEGLPSL